MNVNIDYDEPDWNGSLKFCAVPKRVLVDCVDFLRELGVEWSWKDEGETPAAKRDYEKLRALIQRLEAITK